MLESLFVGGSVAPTPIHLPLAFKMPEQQALRLPTDYDSLTAWRLLSHHIRRYPQDLRAHVQRILIAAERQLETNLPGSLLDLFLALGQAGIALKTRMFELAQPHLDASSKAFFAQQLETPSDAINYVWWPGSLLATGLIAKPHSLVAVNRVVEPTDYANVMAEVQACLEYGQVEQAQSLLEQELIHGRADEAMQQELVNIYQYTRNRGKLDSLIQLMVANGKEMDDRWIKLQDEAQHW